MAYCTKNWEQKMLKLVILTNSACGLRPQAVENPLTW
jgi:hypothetical protein